MLFFKYRKITACPREVVTLIFIRDVRIIEIKVTTLETDIKKGRRDTEG